MSISEFDLIQRYFVSEDSRADVVQGVGDDCAILSTPEGKQLLVSMDTMVSGVHFPEETSPFDIGYKLAAVNLSDLAAMGAEPAWATLSLTLPHSDESWLAEFSSGLYQLLGQYQVQLVGGDTTRGPLSVTMQIHGFVEQGKAITRSGAREGDLIYVSGCLGDAALALQHHFGNATLDGDTAEHLMARLNRPTPRVELGLSLRGMASSMIDLSDGLMGDIGHIMACSQVGAVINISDLPFSKAFLSSMSLEDGWKYAVEGGDDYELCFTVPRDRCDDLEAMAQASAMPVQLVGEILPAGEGLSLLLPSGEKIEATAKGYKHFE